MERNTTLFEKDVFGYLNNLRNSGVTNMFGSPIYVQEEFKTTKRQARILVSIWMANFNEQGDYNIVKDDHLKITPYEIKELRPNQVFVFGSNLGGIHGDGAAKLAYEKFGAKSEVGVGLSGNTYAIPTKDKEIKTLSIEEIAKHVNKFIEYAINNEENMFLVTKIGCGLAGYKDEQIAPLFVNAITVENISLPVEFYLLNLKKIDDENNLFIKW